LKILFAGTPEFAARHLRALLDSEHHIVAVYTQPDRPAGRGKKLTASPVKQLALENQLPVLQPVSLKNEDSQQELAAFNADVMIVVAYGLILPQPVLDAPRYGCINVHASLLPRWRGAAPIQRAIEAGDDSSGVTIMQMDIGLDTGDMLLTSSCPISSDDTAASLHDKLAELGPPALLSILSQMEQGNLAPEKQDDSLASYASKIEKSEALINWHDSADVIQRKICAFNPFPVCFTTLGDARLKIHQANWQAHTSDATPGTVLTADRHQLLVQCGKHALSITRIQLPGKKVMTLDEFANGHSHLCPSGTLLGE